MLIESRSIFAMWPSSPTQRSATPRPLATEQTLARQEQRNSYPPRAHAPKDFPGKRCKFSSAKLSSAKFFTGIVQIIILHRSLPNHAPIGDANRRETRISVSRKSRKRDGHDRTGT